MCTVYDVGHEGATHYIVMEFLEGRTLAAHPARGLMPVDQAVEYALQIADGLSKAHALGVIHRDLKPANVMLTTDGFVKILDFGLSKNFGTTESDNTTVITVSSGLVVGTIAYMAPEQTEGARADVRSDIFSFGVMLYEMLTGGRPFDGSQRGVDDPPHQRRRATADARGAAGNPAGARCDHRQGAARRTRSSAFRAFRKCERTSRRRRALPGTRRVAAASPGCANARAERQIAGSAYAMEAAARGGSSDWRSRQGSGAANGSRS